jgi:hypothetical protein
MPTFRVYEKQTIVYSWLVRAQDLDEAEGAAQAGVPDGANTEKFYSENDVDPIEDPPADEDVYDLQGQVIDEDDEGYTDVAVDGVVIASTRHVNLVGEEA